MEEERLKKLQAGKEKLAAFQKKRAKKKKKRPVAVVDGGEDSDTRISESSSSIDTADYSCDSQSIPDDSDQQSLTSGDELTAEDLGRSEGFEAARSELRFAAERIAELEESLMGKQLALDSLVQENDRLKTVASEQSYQQTITERPAFTEAVEIVDEEENPELSAPVKDTYSSETHQLLQQVQLLQVQLQQAGQTLNVQMTQHQFSAQALLDAKNQMLGLHDKLNEKDRKIRQLESQISQQNLNCSNCSSLELKLSEKDQRITQLEVELTEGMGQLSSLQNLLDSAKRRESESSEVVKQLMVDVESLQKSGATRSVSPIGAVPEGYLSETEHAKHLEKLRNELDEMYGNQIVQMKDELHRQHEVEVIQLRAELKRLEDSEAQLAELEMLRNENADYQQQLQEFTSQLVLQQKDLDLVTGQLNQALMEKGTSVSLVQRLEEKLDAYKQDAIVYQRRISDLDAEVLTLQTQLSDSAKISDITTQSLTFSTDTGTNTVGVVGIELVSTGSQVNTVIETEDLSSENKTLKHVITELKQEVESLRLTHQNGELEQTDFGDANTLNISEEVFVSLCAEEALRSSESRENREDILLSSEVEVSSPLLVVEHKPLSEDSGLDLKNETVLSEDQSVQDGKLNEESESRTVVIECKTQTQEDTGRYLACDDSAVLISSEIECKESDLPLCDTELPVNTLETMAETNQDELHERMTAVLEENEALKLEILQLNKFGSSIGSVEVNKAEQVQTLQTDQSGTEWLPVESSSPIICDSNFQGTVAAEQSVTGSSAMLLKEKLCSKIDNLDEEQDHLKSLLTELQGENQMLHLTIGEYQSELKALQEGRDELRSLTSELDVLIMDSENKKKEAEFTAQRLEEKQELLMETQDQLAHSEKLFAQLTQNYEHSELCRKYAVEEKEVLLLENKKLKQNISLHSTEDVSTGSTEITTVYTETLECQAAKDFDQPKWGPSECIDVSVIKLTNVEPSHSAEMKSDTTVSLTSSEMNTDTIGSTTSSEMETDTITLPPSSELKINTIDSPPFSEMKTDTIDSPPFSEMKTNTIDSQPSSETMPSVYVGPDARVELTSIIYSETMADGIIQPSVESTQEMSLTSTVEIAPEKEPKLKAAVISDIEFRLSELESLNLELKVEKDQLLQDFETLTNNLELLKIVEDEKERNRKKLEVESQQLQSEVEQLSMTLKEKNEELERAHAEVDNVKLELSAIKSENESQTELISRHIAEIEEQKNSLKVELDKSNTYLMSIQSLISSDTEPTKESSDIYEEVRVFISAKSDRITDLQTDITKLQNVTSELEVQYSDVYEEKSSLLQENSLSLEELSRLRAELMEAQNELKDLRYESETMQSLMTDINKEKENLEKSNENLEANAEVSQDSIQDLQYQLSEAQNENVLLRECLKSKDSHIEKYEADNAVLQKNLLALEHQAEEISPQLMENENLKEKYLEQLNKSESLLLSVEQLEIDSVTMKTFLSKALLTNIEGEMDQPIENLSASLENILKELADLRAKEAIMTELEASNTHLSQCSEQSAEDITQLHQRLNEITKSHNNLEKQLENNPADSARGELDEVEESKRHLEEELIQSREQLDRSKLTIKDVQGELTASQAQIETFTASVKTLQQEKEILYVEMSDTELKLEQIEKSNQILNDSLQNSELKCIELNKQISVLECEKEELVMKLQELENKVQAVTEENTKIEQHVTQLTQDLSELQMEKNTECERLNAKIVEVKEKLKNSENDGKDVKESLDDVLQQVGNNREELNKSMEEKTLVEERNKILESELLDIRTMHSIAKDKLQLVQSALDEQQKEHSLQTTKLESQISNLQQELKDSRNIALSNDEETRKMIEALNQDITKLKSENEVLESSQSEISEQLAQTLAHQTNVTCEMNDYKTMFQLEKDSLSAELDKALEQLSELKSIKEDVDETLSSLEQRHGELKNVLEQERKSNVSLSEELYEAQAKIKELVTSKHEAVSNLNASEKLQDELRDDLEQEKCTNKPLSNELNEAQEQITQLKSSRKEAKSNLDRLEKDFDELKVSFQHQEQSNSSLTDELQAAKAELMELDSKKTETENNLSILEKENSELKTTLEHERSLCRSLKTELDQSKQHLNHLQAEQEKMSQSLADVESIHASDLEKLQVQLNASTELESEKEEILDELTFLRNENQKLSSNSQSLMNELEFCRSQHSVVLESIQQEFEKQSHALFEYEHQLGASKQENCKLEKKVQEQAEELLGCKEEYEKQLKTLENENTLCKGQIKDLEENFHNAVKTGKFFEDQICNFESEVVVLDSTAKALREEKSVLSEELENLQHTNKILQEEKQEEVLDKARLTEENMKFAEELLGCKDEYEKQLKTLENENTLCKGQIKDLEENFHNAVKAGKFFEDQICNFESEVDVLDSTAKALRAEKSVLSEELENLQHTNKILQEEKQEEVLDKARLTEENMKLTKDMENMQIQLSNLQTDHSKVVERLERSLQFLTEENNTLQSQLLALMTSKAMTEETNQQLKVQMLGETDCKSDLTDDYVLGTRKSIEHQPTEKEIQTDLSADMPDKEKDQLRFEIVSLKEQINCLKVENHTAEDQFQKLLTEYQLDVEGLKNEVEERTQRENAVGDELELTVQKLKSLEKEHQKLQDMYQEIAGTAVKLGMIPDDCSSQASTEVEDMDPNDDDEQDDDENADILDTMKASSSFIESDLRVLTSEQKETSVEVDKVLLSESMQEEDAEIQAQYKAMLQESSPHKGSSGITYTEEEYEEKLKSLAEKFEHELQTKEEFIRDQHAIEMERMRIEMEYDFREAVDKYEKERKLEYSKKMEGFKLEKEREFVEELRKARSEFEKTYGEKLESTMMPQHLVESHSEPPDDWEEIGRLRIENQELAETRDALLQQLRESHQKEQDMESLLDLVGASPVTPKELFAVEPNDVCIPSKDATQKCSDPLQPEFVPETDRLDPLSAENRKDSADAWQPAHDSFELESALRNSERMSEFENILSPPDASELKNLFRCESSTSGDEDSLECQDYQSKYNQLQSDHDELLVKVNDLEEQFYKTSPSKTTSVTTSKDDDAQSQILDLQIQRETLEQKIKEQRELFILEKAELQQKCHILNLELENLHLFKQDLEQELDSMSDAMERKGKGGDFPVRSKRHAVTQTATFVEMMDESPGKMTNSYGLVVSDQNLLEARVGQLMDRASQYESVITDLKEQMSLMKGDNVLQKLTEEVSQQDRLQEELLQEVRRVNEENESLRSFISNLENRFSLIEKNPIAFVCTNTSNMEEGVRSSDSLEPRDGQPVNSGEESGHFVAAIVEEPGWDADWDKAARQSLDSLEERAGNVSPENGNNRSPDSLDDVSSLCDLMTSEMSNNIPAQSAKQDAATETRLINMVDGFSEMDYGASLTSMEMPHLQEKIYQLEMEKILLKAKVSKLEEELTRFKEVKEASPNMESQRVSSWVWNSDLNFDWERPSSSGDNGDSGRRLARESSSMVESSSTLTSQSGGSVENLLDARFREKTAIRYPTVNVNRETSNSPSPFKESSSYPSVFEDSDSSRNMGGGEDRFSPCPARSLDLTDELADLSKEMKETQDIYVREKVLMREALDNEQINKESIIPRMESQSEDECSDVMELQQKLALAHQTNKFLVRENEEWIIRVKQQEALIFRLQERLEENAESTGELPNVLGQQMTMLQDHRNQLLEKLEEKLTGEKLVSKLIGEKSILEENLRQEKEFLAEKMVERNLLESELLERKLELERTIQDQRFLEEKLYQKDKTEKQLMRQKRMLEEELYEIESKLREREAQLEFEKSKLLHELKEKDLAIKRFEARQNASSLCSGYSSPRLSGSLASLSVASSSSSASRGEPGKIRQIERIRQEVELKHRDAVELLRHQMQVDHSVDELRLREQHAADLASLHQRNKNQLESVKSHYEGVIERLQKQVALQQPGLDGNMELEYEENQSLLQHENCKQMLEKLQGSLSNDQKSELDRFLISLDSEHTRQLEILRHEHSEDVIMQLQAMRISVEQVESSRCQVLREELDRERLAQLAKQREELSNEYSEKIEAVEKSWAERMDRLQSELSGVEFKTDSGNKASSKALLRQLEKQLHEEHNILLQKLDRDPAAYDLDEDKNNIEKEHHVSERVAAEDLLQLCSKMVADYERLQTFSAQLEKGVMPSPRTDTLNETVSDKLESETELSGAWEVEIEEDSQDYSMSDHGEFTDVQHKENEVQVTKTVSGVALVDRDIDELQNKITSLESKLRDFDLLKEALDESDKQVKELVAIVNAKDVILTQLEEHGEVNPLLVENQNKLKVVEEKVSGLEEEKDAIEKQNVELSEKLSTQQRLYAELETICRTQESNLSEEREKVDNLICDIKERETRIKSLEQKLGFSSCDKTESEPQSVDTSLDESQDEVSRALKDAELRHTEEIEEMTQMYNEEQDKLRENLKAARAKEIELMDQIEEMAHQQEQSLSRLREDLQHEHKQEVETMQSEFTVQMDIEVKRVTAELFSKHEEEVEKLHTDYQTRLKEYEDPFSIERSAKVNGDSNSVPYPADRQPEEKVRDNIRKELSQTHEKAMHELTLEWEEKVEKTRLELEERWEDEKAELDRKHAQEVTNLSTQLRDAQDKLNNIIEALDSGDFDSPALQVYRESLQEKVDLELEMARTLLQDEYDEQRTSLEENTAEEATKEREKFIEQHQKMMDAFIAEREKEKENVEKQHAEELEALEARLRLELMSQDIKGESSTSVETEVALRTESDLELDPSSQNEAERSDVKKLNDKLADMRESHRRELEKQEEKLTEIENRHQNEIEEIKDDYEAKLKAFKEELTSSHTDQLEAVAMDTDKLQSDLDKAHQQELDDLEDRLSAKHRKEMGNLEKQMSSKLDELKEKHDEETERLVKQHQLELTKLRDELMKETDEDITPEHKEVVADLSAVFEPATLSEYSAVESDIEIEYESSFIEEDEDEISQNEDGKTTPTEMIQTLGFEEASKLADLATVTPPDDRVAAPDSKEDDSEIAEAIEQDLEESVLSELDHVLQETLEDDESVEVHPEKAVVVEGTEKPGPESLDSSPRVNPRVSQLEGDVVRLESELERKRGEVEWLQRQLVQQSSQYQELRVRLLNYEQLEGDSLINILKSDADRLGQERDNIQRANERLLHLLSNSLKTYLSSEDRINKSLSKVVSAGAASANQSVSLTSQGQRSGSAADQSASQEGAESSRSQVLDGGGDRTGSPDGNSKTESEDRDRDSLGSEVGQNTSLMSVATDEGLDLSHRITESIFVGPDLDPEGEELLRDGSSRLQTAVSRLLDMIEESNGQLLDAQRVHQEFLDAIAAKNDEVSQLSERCTELDERLREEVEAKGYLATELNKAEGLLEGYEVEKTQLQKRLEETEEKILVLVMDLESANTKLHELENSRGEVVAMRQEVARQQVALEANVGTETQDSTAEVSADTEYVEEPALIHEINKLNQDKREVSRQREKDSERSSARIRDLEMTTEEMEKRYEDMLEEKKREIDELLLRVESLDSKLKSNRQFLDEQANDREQEREDHQMEIKKLTKVIQEKEKRETAENRLRREVDDLTEEIQIKTDILNETALRNEQLQADFKEKNMRMHDLEDQVKHLEREIEEKSAMERAFQQKIARLEEELKQDSSASDDTGDASRLAGELDLKKKISSLEMELESRERTIYHERDSLEEELRKARLIEEELTNDKEALQKQVYENLHQISHLKTQLDEFKHRFDTGSTELIDDLKQQLEDEREAVDRKEKEVTDLASQVEQYRDQAMDSDEQVQQITAQLKVSEQQLEVIRSEQNQALKEMMEENNQLKRKLQAQRAENDPTFNHTLLEEKNEEIDHLTAEIEKLRADQSMAEDVTSMTDLLTSLKEELGRKTREIEELHQTVDNLQHSDALLDTTVSDGQEPPLLPSLTERMSIQDEFHDALALKDDEVVALQQELEQKDAELSQAKIDLETSSRLESNPLHEAAMLEKDTTIEQLTLQVESLQQEGQNLTDFQSKLQEDYDMVQSMLEEKQKEIETLTKELTETRPQAEGATDALMKFELQVEGLNKQLKEKDNVIDEKEEELYILNEKLEEKESDLSDLQKLIEEKEEALTLLQNRGDTPDQEETTEVTKLREVISDKELEVEEIRQKLSDQATEQEEALSVLRSQLEIAAKALEERDTQVERLTQALDGEDRADGLEEQAGIVSLKEKLEESEKERESLEEDKEYLNREVEALRAELEKHKQQASQKHQELETLQQQLTDVQQEAERIEVLTEELNRTRSQLQLQQASASNSALSLEEEDQLERLQDELRKAKTELDVFRESASRSAAELEQRIEQIRSDLMREHAENIRELQREAENDADVKLAELSRQHEHQLRQLEENHSKEIETSVRESKRLAEKEFAEEKNQLLRKHRQEVDLLKQKLIEDISVMDVQQQLQSEVTTTERLDSRLLEHLSRPRQDGVGHDNPDVAYLEPPLDTPADETIPDRLQVLMNRLHNEGAQVLTLSELQFLRRHSSPPRVENKVDISALQAAWENEKLGLLSAIQALKDLLAQIHTARETEHIAEMGVSDWRNDLISAISKVFAKERESLLADLRTQVVATPSTELSTLQTLEQKIREQGDHHKSSMDQMFSVDRQSLLAEIRDLRAHASITRLQLQEEKQHLSQQLNSTEEQLSKREHHLKRQLELLEYKLKQEQVLQEDLRVSLEAETTRNQELQSLLNKEHQATLDLQMELSESQSQIDKLNDSLQHEETRVKSVSDAIEAERQKRNQLTDQLEEERAETRRLKRIADEEKRKVGQLEEKEVNLLKTLQAELEKERNLHSEVTNNLEREKLMVDNLRRDLQFEKDNLYAVENQFKTRLAQLQAHLETEKSRCNELNSAINREQSLNEQLRRSLEQERGSVQASTQREQSIISDLKALLQTERGRVEELQTAADRERHHVSSLNAALEEAKLLASEDLERERKTCRELKKQIDSAQEQVLQLSRLHESDDTRINMLQRQQSELTSELKSLKELENERERRRDEDQQIERQRLREAERDRDQFKMKLHDSEIEIQRLRQKLSVLELQLTSLKQTSQHSLRVTPLVNQATSPRRSDVTDGDEDGLKEFRERLDRYKTQLENSRQRLYLSLLKHQEDLSRSETGLLNSESSIRRKAMNDLMAEVQQLQRPLALETEARPPITGPPSVSAINDRVTAHNVELTNFVSRLSKEKAELRNNLAKLEEELWQRKRREAELEQLRGRTDISESTLATERASWNQERITLQMSLDHAEREIERLKADLRAEQHRSLRLTHSYSSESDTDKMNRLYGKYLRSESFRKALIYQKKYLILLLGGFRECEETTLAIIAQMGVYPSLEDVQRRSRHSKAFSTFRTAARVVVAIHRMKYLVKKWRRATKVGSPVVMGNSSLEHGYVATATTYTPPRLTAQSRSQPLLEASPRHMAADVHGSRSAYYNSYSPLSASPSVPARSVATPPTRDKSHRYYSSTDDRLATSSSIRRKLVTEVTPNGDAPHRTGSGAGMSGQYESPHNGHSGDLTDQSLHEDYIHRLESLQQRLGGLNDPGNLRTKHHWSSSRK